MTEQTAIKIPRMMYWPDIDVWMAGLFEYESKRVGPALASLETTALRGGWSWPDIADYISTFVRDGRSVRKQMRSDWRAELDGLTDAALIFAAHYEARAGLSRTPFTNRLDRDLTKGGWDVTITKRYLMYRAKVRVDDNRRANRRIPWQGWATPKSSVASTLTTISSP